MGSASGGCRLGFSDQGDQPAYQFLGRHAADQKPFPPGGLARQQRDLVSLPSQSEGQRRLDGRIGFPCALAGPSRRPGVPRLARRRSRSASRLDAPEPARRRHRAWRAVAITARPPQKAPTRRAPGWLLQEWPSRSRSTSPSTTPPAGGPVFASIDREARRSRTNDPRAVSAVVPSAAIVIKPTTGIARHAAIDSASFTISSD